MGAFISYLHLAHGINNFFVLAPNLTIYNKLIADFTPNTPKYVLQGHRRVRDRCRRRSSPATTTSARPAALFDVSCSACKINIFNISKINTEVRGGRSPRIKRLSEYIGESYFEYLAGLRRPRAAHGRVAPLPAIGGRARHQRAEADPRAGTDGDAVRRDERRAGAVQERHLRLPTGAARWPTAS